MEILRFEEATTTAPKRKKSSKGYLTAGFVAALFGIGTALASATTEIAINNGSGISLGQGVTLAAACDSQIDIQPITAMTLETVETVEVPTFYLTELQINGIDAQLEAKATDTTAAVTGCGAKYFDIQIFNPSTDAAYECGTATNQLDGVTIEHDGTGTPSITCVDSTLSFRVLTEATDKNYTISFDQAPSSISYITLVTRNL
jgi:hypothetical protein